jgi:hypothetical protein
LRFRAITSVVNRYYDPATDQFLSIDPDVAETDQPYVYTDDDPLNRVDPLGDDPSLRAIVVAALTGFNSLLGLAESVVVDLTPFISWDCCRFS